jgi:hypothetical protein
VCVASRGNPDWLFYFLEVAEMNRKFFNAVIEASPDGSRGAFARLTEINPARLTELLKGYRRPTESEFQKLGKVFSPYRLRKFFPLPEKIEGQSAVNE